MDVIRETIEFKFASEEQQRRFHAVLDGETNALARSEELEAALTEIRDLLPIEQDSYSRRVFAIAANALEPDGAAE